MLMWLHLLGVFWENYRSYVISVTLNFMSAVIFTVSYWPALYNGSTLLSLWFYSMKMSNWPSIKRIFVMQTLRNISLCQSCLPEVWFWHPLSVHLHLYIGMSVCSWQMASVSHLYSCLFTIEMVSNVFSVAFRSVLMIHSYVWEKIRIYFCTEKI